VLADDEFRTRAGILAKEISAMEPATQVVRRLAAQVSSRA